jgi:hypothetical protein
MVDTMKTPVWRWIEVFALGAMFASAVVLIVEIIIGQPGMVSHFVIGIIRGAV